MRASPGCNSTVLIPKVTIQHHWWSVNLSHSDLKSEGHFNNNWNGLIFIPSENLVLSLTTVMIGCTV